MTEKEKLVQRSNAMTPQSLRLNFVREYVQTLFLMHLRDVGWFKNHAFMGGTCLRLCHKLQRFSEDLDFVVIEKGKSTAAGDSLLLQAACERLNQAGFQVRAKNLKDKSNVWKTFIIFDFLLRAAGVQAQVDETLQIKIEIDSNPPGAFECEIGSAENFDQDVLATNIIKGRDSTLFGGKMHAVLYRTYTKGRDLYDLEWYLRQKTPINICMVEDTQKSLGRESAFTRSTFLKALEERLQEIDFESAKSDVEPFVNQPEELALIFDRERLMHLVKGIRYYRPVSEQEFMRRLKKAAAYEGDDEKELIRQVESKYFEIQTQLNEEGVYPPGSFENSQTVLVGFIRKNREMC